MLEFRFPVTPDDRGVFNGVELANAFICSAANALSPYVRGCPACLDALFSQIANQILEQVHAEHRAGESQAAMFAKGLEGEARSAAIEAHLAEHQEAIAERLTAELADEPHDHDS